MGECLTLYGTKIDDKGEPFIGSMSLYDDPSSPFIGSSSPYDNGDFDKKITNRLVTNLGFGVDITSVKIRRPGEDGYNNLDL